MPHSSGSWRKTYSLNNKTNRTVGSHVSHPAVDHLNQPHHHITKSGAASATGNSAGLFGNNSVLFKKLKAEQTTDKSTTSSLNFQNETSKERKSEASEKRTVLIPSTGKNDHGCSFTNELTDSASTSDPEMKIKPTLKSSSAVNNPSIPAPVKPLAPVQVKPHLSTAALSNRTVVMPTASRDCTIASSASNLQSQASLSPTKLQLKLDSTQTLVASPCNKKSQFAWVKNQEMVNIKSTPKPVTSGSSPGTATVKRVSSSNKKVSRKPNLSLGAPKTSKYTWVSSSCSSSTAGKANTLTKTPRKPLSPKSLKAPARTSQGELEVPLKEKRCATTLTTLSKKSKGTGASTANADHASRYRWKAAGQSATANASSSTSRTTHKGTVYQWTANKNGQKGEKGSVLSSNPTYMNPTSTPLSAGAFKLRRSASR